MPGSWRKNMQGRDREHREDRDMRREDSNQRKRRYENSIDGDKKRDEQAVYKQPKKADRSYQNSGNSYFH